MEAVKKQTIRLIVSDVDGTLLDSNQKMSDRTAKALRDAIAHGVDVVLATGKTRNAAPYIWERIGKETYGIFLQGMATYNPAGHVIHQKTLDVNTARQVLTLGEDRGFVMMLYSGERILVRAINDQVRAATTKYHEPLPEAVGALQNYAATLPVHKILALGEPRAITALRWQLGIVLGPAARLVQAGVPEMVEILPPGGGKAFALKALLKTLDVRAEEVLALGDAENDIDMLEMVGIGVAMGHAEQRVRDIADYVTQAHDADGVAEAIERFVLPPPPPPAPKADSGATPAGAAPENSAPKADSGATPVSETDAAAPKADSEAAPAAPVSETDAPAPKADSGAAPAAPVNETAASATDSAAAQSPLQDYAS
jgi:Cof subfamily protein (haloacid dehalogenase superfamily)